MSLRFRLAVNVLPCLVLTAVALVQLSLAHHAKLTAWKGGGFGMFSTVDSPSARFVRCSVSTHDGDLRVIVPQRLQRRLDKARAMPTEFMLRALASELATVEWVRAPRARTVSEPQLGAVSLHDGHAATGPALIPRRPQDHDEPLVRVVLVHLGVWRYSFDRDTVRVSATLMREVAVAPPRH
jgi:hypothetical protein